MNAISQRVKARIIATLTIDGQDMRDTTEQFFGLLHWGSQYGDKWSDRAVGPFELQFSQDAAKFDGEAYFKTIRYFNITWRIAGEFCDFEGVEGPDRLEYRRKKKFIGIDMVIPIYVWKHSTKIQLLNYILKQLGFCFEHLIDRASKEREILNETKLRRDISILLKEYKQNCHKKFCK